MKIMTKLNLLSTGIVLVMTVSVLGMGTLIIDDILYGFQERVLRLELANASQRVLQRLNRSGVRAATETAAAIQGQLQQKAGLKSIRFYIVEATDNRIVYHPDFPTGDKVAFDVIDQMFRKEDGALEYNVSDVDHYAVFTTILPVNWLIGISISKGEMLEKRTAFLREIGAITFVILCLNAVAVNLFGERLLLRLGAALDCVKRIEQGDLSARIPAIATRDEIGHLQEGINAMSARIERRTMEQQQAEQALRERDARIRRLVESNIIGVFFWDLRGRIMDANDAFLRIVGYSRQDLRSEDIGWISMTPPESRAADERKVGELARIGTVTPYEKEFTRKDGKRVPVLVGAALFEESQQTGVAFVLDLTERKRGEEALRQAHDELERRVLERTSELKESNQRLQLEVAERKRAEAVLAQRSQELARSNADLEQMAYVASHDLQEPLRMVASYMQLLEKRYQGRLDADAHEFIGFAVDGAKRMQALIDDLLTYSRVGTKTMSLQPVDCMALVKKVIGSVRMATEESGARITCDPLPTVMGDAMRLSQLFQNLIVNAIKFRRDQPPQIHIRAEAAAGFWRFSVQDNGIGIAPEYSDRIFEMFQRLHSRSTYPGTGIGLAICKKIAERHGGRIWVEPAPQQGTIFKFTLPRGKGNAP